MAKLMKRRYNWTLPAGVVLTVGECDEIAQAASHKFVKETGRPSPISDGVVRLVFDALLEKLAEQDRLEKNE